MSTILDARRHHRVVVPSVLLILLLVSAAIYRWLSTVAPPPDGNPLIFLPVWSICFVPYFLACGYVLTSRPIAGRRRWIELGMICLGALAFRLMLLPLPPGLSRDVWRYLWDAHMLVHGYSPYVYAPGARVLEPLRNILFSNARFRNIPTDYPPGAEYTFLLGYLLDPQGLAGIKDVYLAFDIITWVALARLLMRRGIDPRLVVIYAWCPLPIVEFAIEGHLDVVAIAFTILAVLSSTSSRPSARILTGFFLALATLTRLYPVLFLPLLLGRHNRRSLLTFLATVGLGYLPFILLGHGQVLGFLLSYTGQQGGNAGLVQAIVRRVTTAVGLGPGMTLDVEYGVDAVLLATVSASMLILRRRGRVSVELAMLVLIGAVFAVSSHVFPWYETSLLPWIVFSVQPVLAEGWSVARAGVTALAWWAACTAFLGYTDTVTGVARAAWWATFFYGAHGFVIILAMIGAILLVYAGLSRSYFSKPWTWRQSHAVGRVGRAER